MCRSSNCRNGYHIHLVAILVFLMPDIKPENNYVSYQKLCPKVSYSELRCVSLRSRKGVRGILLKKAFMLDLTQDLSTESHTTAQSGQPETQGDVEEPLATDRSATYSGQWFVGCKLIGALWSIDPTPSDTLVVVLQRGG